MTIKIQKSQKVKPMLLDCKKLEKVIRDTEYSLRERGGWLPSDKKAELIVLLYKELLKDKERYAELLDGDYGEYEIANTRTVVGAGCIVAGGDIHLSVGEYEEDWDEY